MKPKEKLEWIYSLLPEEGIFKPYKYYYAIATFLNCSEKTAERYFRTMGSLGWIKEETYGFSKCRKDDTKSDKLLKGLEE